VFGLQSTPVKPMPAPRDGKTWRAWRVDNIYERGLGAVILGSAQTWGGEQHYEVVYPRRRDFQFFDEIARRRADGTRDWGAWVDTSGWANGYRDQARAPEYRCDTINGTIAAEQPGVAKVIPYTDPRSSEDSTTMEEAFHYNPWPLKRNEWDEPVRSWQDMWLFYGKKMLRTAAGRNAVDGFYYDRMYPSANLDTISGGAYRREGADGNQMLQPSLGIFSMRELVRRTAIMYHELGLEPFTIAHMTNNALVPVLAFANLSLDWEDHYGMTDFQTRFSQDLLEAQSMGLQAGVIPLGMGGIIRAAETTDVEFARVTRTMIGVSLVHEVKPWSAFDRAEVLGATKPLMDFGYGLDDCTVYPYWGVIQPVEVTNWDGRLTKTLVAKRDGKAMVVVTDFGAAVPSRNEFDLKVNVSQLGLPPRPVVQVVGNPSNAMVAGCALKTAPEPGETVVRLTSDSKVRIEVSKHDFCILQLN